MWQNNLKTFVELSKKTQEHIALEAGINQGTLSNIIRGRRSASIETLQDITRVLGVSMLDLFQNVQDSEGYEKLQAIKIVSEKETNQLKQEIIDIVTNASDKHHDELRHLLPILQKVLR
jgi:transcriptional regulator with XRE-family HTH domain